MDHQGTCLCHPGCRHCLYPCLHYHQCRPCLSPSTLSDREGKRQHHYRFHLHPSHDQNCHQCRRRQYHAIHSDHRGMHPWHQQLHHHPDRLRLGLSQRL